jgi:hypothetical protein
MGVSVCVCGWVGGFECVGGGVGVRARARACVRVCINICVIYDAVNC